MKMKVFFFLPCLSGRRTAVFGKIVNSSRYFFPGMGKFCEAI